MGQVWAATDEVLERKVALKVTHPRGLEQLAVTQRFKAEANYAAQLSHPNIVEVFDFGVHDGLTFLVMEFIEGPTRPDQQPSLMGVDERPLRGPRGGVAQRGTRGRDYLRPRHAEVDPAASAR